MFSPASATFGATSGNQPPNPVASSWGHDYSFDPGPKIPGMSIKDTKGDATSTSDVKRRRVMSENVAAGTRRSGSSASAKRKSLDHKPRLLKKQKSAEGLNVEGHSKNQSYTQYADQHMAPTPVKKRRTSEDFLTFCRMVLEYEKSLQAAEEENRQRHSSSPMGSTGSSAGSWTSGSASGAMGLRKYELSDEQLVPSSAPRRPASTSKDDGSVVTDGDGGETDDGWDQITCFCNKPYAGLPMVECTSCFTWLHQKCARLKRNRKIPDDWRCFRCEAKKPKSESSSSPKSASSSPKLTGSRKRKSSTSKRRQLDPAVEEQMTMVDSAPDHHDDSDAYPGTDH